MTDARELDGAVALVTGGAGGIGLGIARSLGERGARIVLGDLDRERLEAARAALAETGIAADLAVADVCSAAEVSRMVAEVQATAGAADVLVNSAGIFRGTPFVDIAEDEWDAVLDANLKSVYLCSRAVLPAMIERGGGVIVNIASIAAFHHTTAHVHYAASKAAVIALTRDLAYEVAPHGVRIVAVAPGPIKTRMNQSGLPEELERALVASLRIGRFGDPRDVGEAVAYLASSRASFVTGSTLTVAGGADLSVFSG